jgi:uncharacterized protein YprB with RNaseH-like and TPR domain
MSVQPPVRERWATWNGHEPEAQPPRIVAFDIETTSLKADIGFVLCAVVKPLDGDPIILRLDDLRGESGKPWDDGVLVNTLVEILAASHLAYGWNIRRFDIRFLRTRRLLLGQHKTPRMVSTIDLLQVARRFAFHSNRQAVWMESLSRYQKTEVIGVEWVRAMAGDREAMDYVVQHCLADVMGLEEIYRHLAPYIAQHKPVIEVL